MKITFIFDDNEQNKENLSRWRGFNYSAAINKIGLHSVEIVNSKVFTEIVNQKDNQIDSCQIFFFEGSTNINLLDQITYLKSREKSVIVDLPLDRDVFINPIHSEKTYENSYDFLFPARGYTDQVNSIQLFKWGLRLSDVIFISSLIQKNLLEGIAPVKLIPDFVTLDHLVNLSKSKHSRINIGIITDQKYLGGTPFSTINRLLNNNKIIQFYSPHPINVAGINSDDRSFSIDLSMNTETNWDNFLSQVDIVLIYLSSEYPFFSSRIIYELMTSKIPWISTPFKGYDELLRYGLIINKCDWENTIPEIINHYCEVDYFNVEDAYLFSLGQNIDDHIYKLVNSFNEILKQSR